MLFQLPCIPHFHFRLSASTVFSKWPKVNVPGKLIALKPVTLLELNRCFTIPIFKKGRLTAGNSMSASVRHATREVLEPFIKEGDNRNCTKQCHLFFCKTEFMFGTFG